MSLEDELNQLRIEHQTDEKLQVAYRDLLSRLDRAETGQRALKLGDAMQPVRVALTGGTVSEPVNELLSVVGRDESLARIRAALARAQDEARA